MITGRLDRRATFQSPVKGRNEDGQIITSYAPAFTVWCNVKRLRGGESVMQARLQSRSPAILTVRASTGTCAISSEWRAVIDGAVYEIREDPALSDDRAFLEMLAEAKA